jgi:hypothetical protein
MHHYPLWLNNVAIAVAIISSAIFVYVHSRD